MIYTSDFKFCFPRVFAAVSLVFGLSTVHGAVADTIQVSALDLSKAVQGFGKPGVNTSVDGHKQTLSGKTFSTGFGTHSVGQLIIDLHGTASRFNSTVGIDDEVGTGKGSAEFVVLGDHNKVLWRSGVMHQGTAPIPIDIDLSGAHHLTLRVSDAGDGFNFDHADWANASIQYTGTAPETTSPPRVADPVISMSNRSTRPQISAPVVFGVFPGTPVAWGVSLGGTRPIKYVQTGMPQGLTLSQSTGAISGILTKAGTYSFKVRAQNSAGSDTATMTVVVSDRLALTPPMGWNSYDAYGDQVDEAHVLSNATRLLETMRPAGWDTVVIDYRWYDPNPTPNPDNGGQGEVLSMDEFGRLTPPVGRFPSAADGHGFRALSNRLHALGLRFGIHIMRGIPRNAVLANLPVEGSQFHAADAADQSDKCTWCPDMYGVRGDTAAGKAYYDSIFRLYASWGVDFVKMDDTSQPYHTHEIEAVHDAILKCGRSIVYSLSPGETPIEQSAHVESHANMWRVSGDFWDNWNALAHEFELGRRWQGSPAPGHWPDADMLPLGHISLGNRPVGRDRSTNFTKNEQMTLLTLWSLLPSPLMVGANLPDNDPWTTALLTNPEVIAVDQDALGAGGKLVSQTDGVVIWRKNLKDGSVALGLFNTNDEDGNISINPAMLGIQSATIRDVWMRKDDGNLKGSYTRVVHGHGAVLLRLTPSKM